MAGELNRRHAVTGALALGAGLAAPVAACAKVNGDADWRAFKRRFLAADGRIIDTGNGAISHSEGQGFALLLAQAHGDRRAFDLIWGWTRRTLQRPDGLFAWRYDPRENPAVNDPNNATDGDIFLAWALLRAAAQTRNTDYAQASARIRGAIGRRLIARWDGLSLILPGLEGFLAAEVVTYNPSYFIAPAVQAFHAAAPDEGWDGVLRDGLVLAERARFSHLGLPTDWTQHGVGGAVTPAPGRPPRFGFDALRAPLYLAWGGYMGHAQVQAARSFWTPYLIGRAPPPAWVDVTNGTQADYGLSSGGQALAAMVCGLARPALQFEDYYSAALGLLAAVADRERAALP